MQLSNWDGFVSTNLSLVHIDATGLISITFNVYIWNLG